MSLWRQRSRLTDLNDPKLQAAWISEESERHDRRTRLLQSTVYAICVVLSIMFMSGEETAFDVDIDAFFGLSLAVAAPLGFVKIARDRSQKQRQRRLIVAIEIKYDRTVVRNAELSAENAYLKGRLDALGLLHGDDTGS